jgi:hypothetical protein
VPQSLTTGRRWRRCDPSPLGIGVVSVQPYAAFENVPQPGKDRLVSAAGRFIDPFPIVCARLAGESANKASGEYASRQVSGRRVMRKASGEVASDRVDRRARDMRVRAGLENLADDHWQPPLWSGRAHLMTSEFVLKVSLLEKIL